MNCPICGSTGKRAALAVEQEGVSKLKCGICLHTWINVSRKRIVDFHRKKVTWQYKDFEKRDSFIEKRKALILKACNPKSILDIGCGDGAFLDSWPSSIRKTGIDLNEDIPVHGTFTYIKKPFMDVGDIGKFDLVTSFHSMEHVHDCVGMLRRMIDLAKRAIAIEVPVNRHLRVFKEHIHSFSYVSFKRMMSLHAKDLTAVAWAKKIQGSSLLWVGKKD